MAEEADFISQLVSTSPKPVDPISQGDDHIRTIKRALQNTFPEADGELYVPDTPNIDGSTTIADDGRWVENTSVKTNKQGKITATKLVADTVDVNTVDTNNFTTTDAQVDGTLVAPTITTTDVTAAGTVNANYLEATNSIITNSVSTGPVTCSTLSASGNIVSSGTITANKFKGDGSQLTNLDIEEVDAYTKVESDGRFQPKGNYATATHNHTGVYQPAGNYATAGSSYTKTESNTRYALIDASYNKTDSDNRYAAANNTYTMSQSDGRYEPKGNYADASNVYTKAESDGRYEPKGSSSGGTTYSAGTGLQLIGTQFSMKSQYPGNYGCSGSFTATGNVTAYSDDRLKVREGDVEDALYKVNSIDTFYYTPSPAGEYIGMEDKRNAGVSAQQVQEIFPEAVIERDGYLAVDYGRLVILCIEAIKSLSEGRG